MADFREYGRVADINMTASEAVNIVGDILLSPQLQDLAYHRLMYLASLEEESHSFEAWRNLSKLMLQNATNLRETVFRAFKARCPDKDTSENLTRRLLKMLLKRLEEYSFGRLTLPAEYWMKLCVCSASELEEDITERVQGWINQFSDMPANLENLLVQYVVNKKVAT
ncbi:MAG: hypothetical protein JKX80_00435 [Candidatus Pacebacteria bacterium]|nr:hypothetical protein [Candidatus Paceibacterota bacterium]